MPVAGQPGRYVTGLLPVLEEQKTSLPPPIAKKVAAVDILLKGRLKLVVLIAVVVLVVFSSFAFFLVQSHNGSLATGDKKATGQNTSATATVNSAAGSDANVIVKDPLDGNGGNIHNLLLGRSGGSLYTFKNDAYHITVNSQNSAIALLPSVSVPDAFVYTLTMQAIRGDETGTTTGPNAFGMIFCFNQQIKGKKTITTFYSFDVVNVKNGEYQFQKYQGTSDAGNTTGTWAPIWPKAEKTVHFGNEFHFGHSPKSKNTFSVVVNGNKFTFVVNGKQVGTAQDASLKKGGIGMFVNLQGTEVAFSNLLLTSN